MVEGHPLPEELGRGAVGRPPREDMPGQHSQHLRHLGVAVLAPEDVLAPDEGLDEGPVLEAVGQAEPAVVAGVGPEVDEDLVHAPELGAEHLLDLRVVELGQDAFGPGREARLDLEGRPVAGEAVGVAQAGEDLVLDVPRRPHAVEVEPGRADVPRRDLVVKGLARRLGPVGLGPDVAVAVLVLHGPELRDEIVRPLLEARVAGRGEHQAHAGEVVAGDVAGQLAVVPVPAAVSRGLGLEPGGLAEEGHHPVRREREQVGGVLILGLFQRAAGQTDIGERQRPGFRRDRGLDRPRGGGRQKGDEKQADAGQGRLFHADPPRLSR